MQRLVQAVASKRPVAQGHAIHGMLSSALVVAGVLAVTSSAAAEDGTAGPRQAKQPDGIQPEQAKASDGAPAKQRYQVYARDGNRVTLKSVVDAMADKQVVLLGEYHDDPVAHALELQLLRMAHKAYHGRAGAQGDAAAAPGRPRRHVGLSLEMLERDVQGVLDEYLAGHILERDLAHDARLWPNWLDYRPLVQFCKAHGLPVVAANAPRRYVSLAGRQGREALTQLPPWAAQWLPGLPYALPTPAYVERTNALMRMAREAQEEDASPSAATPSGEVRSHAGGEAVLAGPDGVQRSAVQQDGRGDTQRSTGRQADADGTQREGARSDSADRRAAVVTKGTPDGFEQQRQPQAVAQAASDGVQQAARPETVGQRQVPLHAASTQQREEQQESVKQQRPAEPPHAAIREKDGTQAPEAPACPWIGLRQDSKFLDAQSLWDAAMAHSLAQHLAADASALLLHCCGKFHCEGAFGIPEHLKQYAPTCRSLTVIFMPAYNSMELTPAQHQHEQLAQAADFVVLTDASLPRSFNVMHPV